METQRLFIALQIGSDIRARLKELQQKLKIVPSDVRWVKPEMMHLTLAFLGNVPMEHIQPLEEALDELLQSQAAFTLTARGTGTFERRKRPGTIWAGIVETPALMELRQTVELALNQANIPFNATPFRPHLTLGRFKSTEQAAPLLQTLEKEQQTYFGEVHVHSVDLLRSKLQPDGARHTLLQRSDL